MTITGKQVSRKLMSNRHKCPSQKTWVLLMVFSSSLAKQATKSCFLIFPSGREWLRILGSVRVIKTESRLSSRSLHGVTVLSLIDACGCHGDKWLLLLLKTLAQIPLDNVIGYLQPKAVSQNGRGRNDCDALIIWPEYIYIYIS